MRLLEIVVALALCLTVSAQDTDYQTLARTAPEGACGLTPSGPPGPILTVPLRSAPNSIEWKVGPQPMPDPASQGTHPSVMFIAFAPGFVFPDGFGLLPDGSARGGRNLCSISVLPQLTIPFSAPYVNQSWEVFHILGPPIQPGAFGFQMWCQWIGLPVPGLLQIVTSDVIELTLV